MSESEARPEVRAILGRDGYRVESAAGPFTIPSDMPEDAGGAGSAARPYEILLAALGACGAMTMKSYAERKGWPLEGVEIAMRHERRKAEPGDPAANPAGWVFIIHHDVRLIGDELTDEQRERLLSMAEVCPVKQSLTHGVRFEG